MRTEKDGKVRVRIAVAVDCEGNWGSCGWGGARPDELMGMAIDPLDGEVSTYWIEAWVDVPNTKTVDGAVIPVAKGEMA